MSAKSKKWEPLIYSGLGVAAVFIILVAVAILTGAAKIRLDLTAEKLYTLSAGTKKVLARVDTPVVVHYYCTQSENEMPVALKTYAKRVEDLLTEYRQVSGGKIEVQKFDPQPDSDAEDSAKLDGVEGQALGGGGIVGLGEKVYLGLAIICLDRKETIAFLDPSREKLLEYDITRALSSVINPQKKTIGVMSGLPVAGQQMNPMAMRMGQQGGSEPWVFYSELKRDFNVKQVEMTADKIDDDIQMLLVVHPSGITDKTQYLLDQFVLRGGKLALFLDPMSVVDSRNSQGMQNMLQRAASGGSNAEKLLKAWGLEFDSNKVIADTTFKTMLRRGNGGASPEPTWLSLTTEGIDSSDVVTAQIDNILLPFAGAFTGTPAAGLTQTVLLKTSTSSAPVDKMMAQFGGDTTKDFNPSGKQLSLAVRLQGKFKTAFPDGAPAADKDPADKDAKPKEEKKEVGLKESAKDGVVILVGDSDLLYDQFCVQVQNFFGQKMVQPFNGNLNLLQNIVEQLTGDSDLIGVRSRAVQNRPFTLVNKIQAQAEDSYRAKIKSLESDLSEAQQKLNELQRSKEGNQRFILSPEQQAEIKKFNAKEAQVKRELKDVRKQLRKDIDALENRLKWYNIAGMPVLVTGGGILLLLGVFKRKRTAAK